MRENFPACLKEILRHEGGYSNHKHDAGGATNKGVTQATYDGYRRSNKLLPRSVQYITDAEVADCYKRNYWDKVCGDQLPKGIDLLTFDAAVNSGPARAERWLQQAINKVAGARRLKEDAQVGYATIDASDDYPADKIIDAYIDLRLGFMKVAKNTKTGVLLWNVFGVGWSNRLLGSLPKGAKVRQDDGVLQVSKRMAAAVTPEREEQLAKPDAIVVMPAAKPPLPPEAMVRPAPGYSTATKLTAATLALASALIASGVQSWLQP